MIKICIDEIERLKELSIPWPDKWEVGDYFSGGIQSSKLITPEKRDILSVGEAVSMLGAPKLYLGYDPGFTTQEVDSNLLILSYGEKLLFLYDHTFYDKISRIVMFSRFPKGGDHFVLESEDDISLFNKTCEWKRLKTQLDNVVTFLEDPWTNYEARKKSYEQRLVKIKASIENKIKVYEATKIELKKKMKALKNGLLSDSFGIEKKIGKEI